MRYVERASDEETKAELSYASIASTVKCRILHDRKAKDCRERCKQALARMK